MLTELHIRNFAIIDRLQLSLGPGFVALTGETGAGKSILIDGLEMVLGGRSDSTFVRAGTKRALLEATFRLSPQRQERLRPILEREGLEGDEPDLLLLSREIRAGGRSVARVNGRAVRLSLMREIAEGLVDIHGQSEHLSLLRVPAHLELLDRYADLGDLRARVADKAKQIRATRRERRALERDEQELARRVDLLQYQIAEIEAAGLEPGEDEELAAERVRLANAEQLAGLLAETLQAVDEGSEKSPPALDSLGLAVRLLERLARIDASLDPQLKEAEDLTYRLQDLARGLRDYQEQVEFNPRRLAEVEERLNMLRRLERKYGPTIPDILAYAERVAQELDDITHSEERIAALQVQEERLLAELGAESMELSTRRREAAQTLATAIEKELADLRMEGTRFGVDFRWKADVEGAILPQTAPGLRFRVSSAGLEFETGDGEPVPPMRVAFDGTGIDRVEFLVSPNPGEPLKPLARIASGGETSRLMLALKTVLSRVDETPTLIFDEIDQGIGGRVGSTVGEKLWALTDPQIDGYVSHQVLCVTHLPQLAGFGDLHLKVEKAVAGDRTVTRILPLQEGARVEELAQMLGGGGEAARRSAEEILRQVAACKGRRQTSPPDDRPVARDGGERTPSTTVERG